MTAERDDHDRLPSGTPVDGFDRPLMPGVCGAGTIAGRDRCGKPRNGEPCGPRPDSFMLRVEVTSGHASASLAFVGSSKEIPELALLESGHLD